MDHAYPEDLASFLRDRWGEGPALSDPHDPVAVFEPLPDDAALKTLLSVCYQASLLREEERPVTFRLALCEPAFFAHDAGPPSGFHSLVFARPRRLDEHELRRLAPAAPFVRALIGVRLDPVEGYQIWGVVQSGPRWMQASVGGRAEYPALPPVPVVYASGPGALTVARGSVTLCKLEGGQLSEGAGNALTARWLPSIFGESRAELYALHQAARAQATEPWATLDPDITRLISQHMVRRLVAMIRGSRHGGMVIIVPPEKVSELCGPNPHIVLKYPFERGPARERFRTLIVAIMNTLAAVYGRDPEAPATVGWREYVASRDETLAELDEGVFEVAHLVAALAAVDGAVVLTRRFELLGFGGEITGSLADVTRVARAIDAEATQRVLEDTDGVGTRHRSAYRLCSTLPDALAIVVSQDGGVRFVHWKDGFVTYWDNPASSFLE